MSPAADPSAAIGVLIADSNRMQAQLLAGALRRHPEFRITPCTMDFDSLYEAATAGSPRVALMSLNSSPNMSESIALVRRFHLADSGIAKILLIDTWNRGFVI